MPRRAHPLDRPQDRPQVSPLDIEAAHRRIRGQVADTPVIESKTLSGIVGCTALFKLESLQMTGSFKERGALNKLLLLGDAEKTRGVIAASAGNHAQSLAYHGQRLGVSVKIVMPEQSPIVKIKSTEHWGAEVILQGATFDDAVSHSHVLAERENLTYIHPFDDPDIVAGQGTVAIEILAHPLCESLDAILVPVGGGGLIAGIATLVKRRNPRIQVIGVEEAACKGMSQALREGAPVKVPTAPFIADGIAVREVGADNLRIVNELVDEVVSVTSDEIANAVMLMLEIEKLVVEGAAATTLAALVNRKLPGLGGKRVVSVISGGNMDVNLLSRIIERGLTFDGRVARIESVVPDRPGGLEQFLGVIRELGANVLEVHHHRFTSLAPIGQVGIAIVIETRDKSHLRQIEAALKEKSYEILGVS